MKILQILKHDLKDERNRWASCYCQMRKENPTKARILFRRLQAAKAVTESALQANVMGGPRSGAEDD